MAYHPGGSSVQGQTLDVTVSGCYNLKDTEWFSRQDPYVVLEYSGQRFRTRTDTDGGKNPTFSETFKFALIEGLREMNATVWNSNTIDRDSYIGSTKILLSKVIESGYDDTQWPLTDARSKKSSGVLKLILHYDSAKSKPGKPEGMTYPYATPSASAGYQGHPPAAYPPAVPAYGPIPHHAQQQQQPAPGYPPAPMYQAAPSAPYPPVPMAAYVAPPPPAQSSYYQAAPPSQPSYFQAAPPAQPSYFHAAPPAQPSYFQAAPPAQPSYFQAASPAYGAASAPPYQTYPPAGYAPAVYPPYPPNR